MKIKLIPLQLILIKKADEWRDKEKLKSQKNPIGIIESDFEANDTEKSLQLSHGCVNKAKIIYFR